MQPVRDPLKESRWFGPHGATGKGAAAGVSEVKPVDGAGDGDIAETQFLIHRLIAFFSWCKGMEMVNDNIFARVPREAEQQIIQPLAQAA